MKKKPLTEEQLQDAIRLKAIFNAKKKTLGLSQEALADALGIVQGAVSHYLNGVNPLNPKAASSFARVLQVPVSEFSPSIAEEIALMAQTLSENDIKKYQGVQYSEQDKVYVQMLNSLPEKARKEILQELGEKKQFFDQMYEEMKLIKERRKIS